MLPKASCGQVVCCPTKRRASSLPSPPILSRALSVVASVFEHLEEGCGDEGDGSVVVVGQLLQSVVREGAWQLGECLGQADAYCGFLVGEFVAQSTDDLVGVIKSQGAQYFA